MYTFERLAEHRTWAVICSDWQLPVAEYECRRDAASMAEWANRQVREGNLSEDEIHCQLRLEAADLERLAVCETAEALRYAD